MQAKKCGCAVWKRTAYCILVWCVQDNSKDQRDTRPSFMYRTKQVKSFVSVKSRDTRKLH